MVATQALTRQEAEDFLFEESRLIDERQLENPQPSYFLSKRQ